MFRFRDFRKDEETREHYAEVSLAAANFIYPYFVTPGINKVVEIPGFDDVYVFTIDQLLVDIEDTIAIGIKNIYLFGIVPPDRKDTVGTAAYEEGNLIQQAIRAIKNRFPQVRIFTDVCLSAYTSHGHSGLVANGKIDNDSTLPLLAKMALGHSQAGADFVCPTAMMDGQVESIRKHLNLAGKYSTGILSCSVKYASSFHEPYSRGTGQNVPSADRKSYQVDYRNLQQVTGEVWVDVAEGADWIMVNPAHTYLDVIYRLKSSLPSTPLVAFHSSGEYMAIKAAAKAGILHEQTAFGEVLTAIKRAGATMIISYYAKKYIAQQFNSKTIVNDFMI